MLLYCLRGCIQGVNPSELCLGGEISHSIHPQGVYAWNSPLPVKALTLNRRESASGYAKLEVFCNRTQVLYIHAANIARLCLGVSSMV